MHISFMHTHGAALAVKIRTAAFTGLAALCCWFASPQKADANEAGMALGNDAIYLNGTYQVAPEPYFIGIGYLYHDNSKHLQHIDLFTRGNRALFNLPIRIDLGIRALNLSTKGPDGQALALGASARSNIPAVPGLATEASLFLAPKVLSFDDIEGMVWTQAEVNYRIIRQAEARLGYRYIRVKSDKTKFGHGSTLDTGLYVGFRFLF